MAGEMIKPQYAEKNESYWSNKVSPWGCSCIGDDGLCIRPNYPIHFKLADALKRRGYDADVQPFDIYQGCYISVNGDIRMGNQPYQYCPQGLGIIRLWLVSDESGMFMLYREDTDKSIPINYNNIRNIISAAVSLLKGENNEI